MEELLLLQMISFQLGIQIGMFMNLEILELFRLMILVLLQECIKMLLWQYGAFHLVMLKAISILSNIFLLTGHILIIFKAVIFSILLLLLGKDHLHILY